MKQIIQNYRTGKLELADVPVPHCSSNTLLIKNRASLVSLGTERSVIELGRKTLLGKAKARPDLVKRFIEKAKKEGFVKTFKEALDRLDESTPLGYSSAGTVVEAGKSVHKFSPGDRVACIGAGYASHADYITVPENLCCKLQDNLSFEEAAFGMLGIIAMHGSRCAGLTFGGSVAVIGLGLIGLLAVQILNAYGCKVIGMDIDPFKVELAKKFDAAFVFNTIDDLKNGVDRATDGFGTDAVVVAAATKSDAPIHTAVEVVRNKGRVVILGVADIHPERNEMWHKEVEILVSKAGGPGIFDPLYENRGGDYPIEHVRWTENRNLEEFLRLVSGEKVDVKSLITHRFRIDHAESVYKDMMEGRGSPYIGVILEYSDHNNKTFKNDVTIQNYKRGTKHKSSSKYDVSLGVIGAGLFGRSIFLPALRNVAQREGVRLHSVSTSSSENAYHTGRKYRFENFSTDYKEILSNPQVDAVIILTPHSLHARMVIEALNAGKMVFVEKPLCIDETELNQIRAAYSSLCEKSSPILHVGYNRRFSPHARRVKMYLKDRQNPLVITYRINPGFVPIDHWVHSEEEGGSRIVGEVCHFIDLMQFFTESDPLRVYAERISANNKTAINSDNVAIVIKFSDGSIGNMVYTASGDRSFPREVVEIFFEGHVIALKDYSQTLFYRNGKKKQFKTTRQEMGYREELTYFFNLVRGNTSCKLTSRELFSSTLTTFKINESLGSGKPSTIGLEES